MRRISTSATSASPASTSSDVAGPKAPESVPARAGPTTRAPLKLVVSSALAGGSSSSGHDHRDEAGEAAERERVGQARQQDHQRDQPSSARGPRPARASPASSRSGSGRRPSAARRRPVRSSQAPSSGPEIEARQRDRRHGQSGEARRCRCGRAPAGRRRPRTSRRTRARAWRRLRTAGSRAGPGGAAQRSAVHQASAGGIAWRKRNMKSGSTCFLISRRRGRFEP